jgi:branched-subunit amino acid transport protein
MTDYIIILMLGYVFVSFLLTALFVRLGKQAALAKKVRQHFYWFPFIPPALVMKSLLQGIGWVLRSALHSLRRGFEILSGAKTYRRQKISDYYGD